MAIRDEFYHASILVLDRIVMSAVAREARGPGSSSGPGYDFLLQFYN